MTFKFKVKVKGKDVPVFKEGMEAGVLSEVEVEFKSDDPLRVAISILDYKQQIMEETVEVLVEEVK